MIIDLHTHTSASDGTFSPEDLVDLAVKKNVKVLAITDHDTISGLSAAKKRAQDYDIEIVGGCELSCSEKSGWMHILGLFLFDESYKLQNFFSQMQINRGKRNLQMVEKLDSLGIVISYDEVFAKAKGTIGRPHIGSILMEKKIVSSMDEVFSKYLGSQGLAYFPKEDLPTKDAIEAIHEAGGIAVLAHPFKLGKNLQKIYEKVKILKEEGLDGIEVFYPEHSWQFTQDMISLARKLDLVSSGGSDFHGTTKPKIDLGIGKGSLHIPAEILEPMRKRVLNYR